MARVIKEKDCCPDCDFCSVRTYENGTGWFNDYHCTLQNGKLIYSAFNAFKGPMDDLSSFPECPVGLFEEVQ